MNDDDELGQSVHGSLFYCRWHLPPSRKMQCDDYGFIGIEFGSSGTVL